MNACSRQLQHDLFELDQVSEIFVQDPDDLRSVRRPSELETLARSIVVAVSV